MRRFEDIRCLVTGGADGIGHATAVMLLAEGGRVLVCDRNPAGLEDLAGAVKLELDVTAADAGERLMATAQSELGGLDVLVNNAGVAAVLRWRN